MLFLYFILVVPKLNAGPFLHHHDFIELIAGFQDDDWVNFLRFFGLNGGKLGSVLLIDSSIIGRLNPFFEAILLFCFPLNIWTLTFVELTAFDVGVTHAIHVLMRRCLFLEDAAGMKALGEFRVIWRFVIFFGFGFTLKILAEMVHILNEIFDLMGIFVKIFPWIVLFFVITHFE